jgi:hypothetical protein
MHVLSGADLGMVPNFYVSMSRLFSAFDLNENFERNEFPILFVFVFFGHSFRRNLGLGRQAPKANST